MQDIINVVVQNGLGVASFVAMIFFYFNYSKEQQETTKKMCDTLVQIQISMATMTDRIDKIEEKINNKKEVL